MEIKHHKKRVGKEDGGRRRLFWGKEEGQGSREKGGWKNSKEVRKAEE